LKYFDEKSNQDRKRRVEPFEISNEIGTIV
jgi:hypothetical protein